LNKLRAGKYTLRAAYLVIWAFVAVIVAGPILGALTPQVSPQAEYGLGINLQTVQPQLQQIFSSTATIGGSHTVTVHAFNKWILPASIGLSLSLSVNGQLVYQTSKASVSLAPLQSGNIYLTVQIPPSVLAQMEGQQIVGGGQMTIGEGGLWSISVSLGGVP
jgi:hypothetical protein